MPPSDHSGAATHTPRLVIGVLGDVTVWDRDGAAAPMAPQLRRLVGLLVTTAPGFVTADRLAHHITGGTIETSAVRTAISRLRRLLGHRVETKPAGYRLHLEAGELDADRFVDLITRATTSTQEDRGPMLHAALELWRGSPFGDLGDESWAVGSRQRLDEFWAAGAEMLAAVHIEHDRPAEAITLLRRLVEAHPFREAPVALLMQQLAAGGRTVEALREYQRLRGALADVGLEPSPAVRRAERDVLNEALRDGEPDGGHLHIERKGNLTAPADSFIGRDRELKTVTELTKARLVTLVGAGGVGKTRLAVEAAAGAASSFPSGVWFIPLAPLSVGADVVATSVAALDASVEAGRSPVQSIIDTLRGGPALVVVDNAEHVIDTCVEFVEELLMGTELVHLLVTSREPLGIRGEQVHHVAPLDAFDSVELFCARAREADDRFEMGDDDRSIIESMCQRLDGLPLAIELTAARTRTMTVADLHDRLDDQVALPRRGHSADHHATMRATIDRSYHLLGDDERTVFEALGVFAGSFDLAAAATVCALDPDDVVEPAGIVLSLVNKSMVVADRTRSDTRYSLLETIRRFSLDQLAKGARGDELRARHLAYFTAVAKQAEDLTSDHPARAKAILDAEWDNFRGALQYALQAGDVEAAAALVTHLSVALEVGRHEHAQWIDAVLDVLPEQHEKAPFLWCLAGWWANLFGDHRTAIRLAERGLAATAPGQTMLIIMLRVVIAEARVHLGDPADAFEACEAVLRLGRDDAEIRVVFILACWAAWTPRPDLVAGFAARIEAVALQSGRFDDRHQAAYSSGIAALVDGDPGRAIERFHESTRCAAGYPHLEAEALQGLTLAVAAASSPDVDEIFLEALQAATRARLLSHAWMVLETLAIHWADQGRVDEAAVLLGALESHERRCVFLAPRRRRAEALVAARPAAARFTERGRSMSRTELTDHTMAVLASVRDDTPGVPTGSD